MKKIPLQSSYCLRNTSFGEVAILWSVYQEQPKILRVVLSNSVYSAKQYVKTSFPYCISASCTEIDVVAEQMLAFLTGNDTSFSLDVARLDLCSPFQQKVLPVEHEIPRGYVSTYQRIARHLGMSNGARAVGTALANNPFPLIIPCHRAIRSDKTLGGYQGGLEMKRTLLEMENIDFNDKGQVATQNFFY
jgi:methylated-DNA-[protein]-cysteine S-methyltransferase